LNVNGYDYPAIGVYEKPVPDPFGTMGLLPVKASKSILTVFMLNNSPPTYGAPLPVELPDLGYFVLAIEFFYIKVLYALAP